MENEFFSHKIRENAMKFVERKFKKAFTEFVDLHVTEKSNK